MRGPGTIHYYRPQRSNPEELESILVGREPMLEEMLTSLGRWSPKASRDHFLLIGPRGIGKTCVLQVLAHRIRTGSLHDKWQPIALSEEGYGLQGVADILIQALEGLLEQTPACDERETLRKLKADSDDQRVCDLALDAFRRFHRSTGRGIALMLENLNRLLDEQFRRNRQAHLLRKILIEEDWLVLIATSPTYVQAVTEAEEPLYAFFHQMYLNELTSKEQLEMLNRLAQHENNTQAQVDVRRFRPRAQALYHFTGGNPRLTVMLYQIIVHQQIDDVQQELTALLDQLSPYYQDCMRDLAPQERALIECMALLTEGCTPTELANASRMEAKTVRALLTRLERGGYVRREERKKKQTVYFLPDRFFRIWHQLACSRALGGQVRYLLEYFSIWYAPHEEWEAGQQVILKPFHSGTGGNHVAERNAAYMESSESVSILRAAFVRRDLAYVREYLTHTGQHPMEGASLMAPCILALNYLDSGRDDSILTRLHPELREAVMLLVDAYDGNIEAA
ncbi:MAG: hypothetical protein HYV27_01655 [Candidatus Hydrogenedentes bacterium]|nr:hypothetical protein [Candidatus Hydrogenedentota bacterium]